VWALVNYRFCGKLCFADAAISIVRWAELSYFATDSQSVSQSVLALRPSGTHDQILTVVRQLWDGVMGHPPWRVNGSVTQGSQEEEESFYSWPSGWSRYRAPSGTPDQMFAFSDFYVVKSIGRHPCRDDGSVFFFLFFETSSAFTFVSVLLPSLSNITVFLFSVQSPTFKNYTRRISPRARHYKGHSAVQWSFQEETRTS